MIDGDDTLSKRRTAAFFKHLNGQIDRIPNSNHSINDNGIKLIIRLLEPRNEYNSFQARNRQMSLNLSP